MSVPKCSECKFAQKGNFPRNGNSGSWKSGHFYQVGYYCCHKRPPMPNLIFYGKTSPKTCPLRKEMEK